MKKYGLFTMGNQSFIILTHQDSLESAKQHFMGMKNLGEKEFNKIFIVQEIKKNDQIKY